MAWTTLLWIAFGYSMSFGPTVGGILATRFPSVPVRHPPEQPVSERRRPGHPPTLVHVAYQMMFAIITPALITGAFANRVTFKAYLWFLTAWLIFGVLPVCHMLWSPEGILSRSMRGCLEWHVSSWSTTPQAWRPWL